MTVDSSTASTPLTVSGLKDLAGVGASSRWLSAPTTVSAFIAVPSWNSTSSRRVTVHSVGEVCSHDSASPGCSEPSKS